MKRPRRELIRLCLSSEGQLQWDRRQTAAGRGAYLCGKGCLGAAVKRRAFSRAFKGKAAPSSLVGLEAAMEKY